MRRIYFVRHGSPIRLPGQFIGRMDSPLTEKGMEEAERTGKWFCEKGFDGKTYASPLSRAYDTARIILDEVKKGNKQCDQGIEVVEGFTECDFGLFDGKSKEEFSREYPAECAYWFSNPYKNAFPQGESFSESGKRFAKALEEVLAKNKSGDILIVAHMCSIQSFFIESGLRTFGVDFVEKPIACASISSVVLDSDGKMRMEEWGLVPS